MPVESEELKLIVTLVDNASAGLDKIYEKTKQLGGPEVKQAHEKMREGTKELNKAIGEITGGFGEAFKALGAFRGGLVAGVGGLAIFGIEMTKQIGELKKWAEELRGINQAAKQIGVDPAQMKSLIEQFGAAGVGADQVKANIAKLAEGLADLDRVGSRINRDMMRFAGPSPEAQQAMRDFLNDMRAMAHQGNIIGAAERLREARQQVLNNALREGKSLAEATNRANEFASRWWDQTLDQAGKLNNLTKEDQEIWDQRLAKANEYANVTGRIGNEWSSIVEELKAPFLDKALDAANRLLAIFTSIHEYFVEANKETTRRTDLDKVLPETNPLRSGFSEWRQRQQQREYYLQHPGVQIPGTAAEAAAEANRKLNEENTDATKKQTESTKKLDQSTQELLDELRKANQGYSPTSFTGTGFNPSMVQNASFTTGGPQGFAGQRGGPYGPFGGGRRTSPSSPSGAGGGGGGGPAQLNDESGRPIDHETMRQAEELGRAGDVAGLQRLFAAKGYHASGPYCGMVASAYVKSAGFKPPAGSAVATNWHNWGEQMKASGINEPGHPFGSMVGTYWHRRYGGNLNQMLGTGQTGGHVMTIVPGTYDPKTNTAMFADQQGIGVRRRSLNDLDLRYAGDPAVAALRDKGVTSPSPTGAAAGADDSELADAAKWVAAKESFNPRAFGDYGQTNIGYGTSAHGRTSITEPEARAEMTGKLAESMARINAMNPKLTRGQRIALASLDFNTGWTTRGGEKNDALRAAIKSGDIAGARKLFRTYTHVGGPQGQELPGLKMRREEEVTAFDDPYFFGKPRDDTKEAGTKRGGYSTFDLDAARKRIDGSQSQSHKVEGSGKISVDVNAPKGTRVNAEGGGIFKDVEVNRQTQMDPASRGPETQTLSI